MAGLFKQARERRGLSISETALLAGLTPRALAYIESGAINRPHMRTVRAVAGVLGVEPQDLIPGSGGRRRQPRREAAA